LAQKVPSAQWGHGKIEIHQDAYISAVTSWGVFSRYVFYFADRRGCYSEPIQAVATANPERAFQASLTYNGIVATLSIEVVPTRQRGDDNACGATATDPTTGPPA
jgi:hypothetical protein